MSHLKLVLLFGLASAISIAVYAHGEHAPGPHEGFIRMPGAFHTELLKVSDSSFKVYLLDIHFQNPTVRNSTLSAKAKRKSTEANLVCAPDRDAFVCTLPKRWKWRALTEITVDASREGAKGNSAVYKIPLCKGSDPKC